VRKKGPRTGEKAKKKNKKETRADKARHDMEARKEALRLEAIAREKERRERSDADSDDDLEAKRILEEKSAP